jgi:hypothetical protein
MARIVLRWFLAGVDIPPFFPFFVCMSSAVIMFLSSTFDSSRLPELSVLHRGTPVFSRKRGDIRGPVCGLIIIDSHTE